MHAQLNLETRLSLLRTLWRSRLGDLREQSLIRQGNGWFHISGMGHEALAAISLHLQADDYAFPYYRDRAFCLQRGVSDFELALAFYAKRDSSSGGRQLTGHFSHRALNIWSHPSPVGAHLLPACGAAWGMQLDSKPNIVYASLGEAAARQGDFFEAVCFAKERKLPMVFVVQDNRIAISTTTSRTNPLALGIINPDEWLRVDGSHVEAVAEAGRVAVQKARSGEGPAFIWCDVERFSNHSSADDQRMYRSSTELESMHQRDPIHLLQQQMIADGQLEEDQASAIEAEVRAAVKTAYQDASRAADPIPEECGLHLTGSAQPVAKLDITLKPSCRMLDAVNQTFHHVLKQLPEVIFFGEDIADPKGGVFNLTKGLSKLAPQRAFNAPLAESTIMGVAVGLASYGKRPCFEIQFVDFIYPGWNQLVTNMATLRWRSFGQWSCPLVIYAPCGGYLPGGALWHSQSGESALAGIPGINVVMPSTPGDAAGLFWTALQGSDPTIVLLPKHLIWAELPAPETVIAVPIGAARVVREGELLTLVTWGNCIELVAETLESLDTPLDIELIDLRSIAPWDRETITASLLKTGRLMVVQEDTLSSSVAQMIVAEMCGLPEVLQRLKAPPVIIAREDVHVGFNPIYEYAALPDKQRILAGLERLLAFTLQTYLESSQTLMNTEKTVSENDAPGTARSAATHDQLQTSKMIAVPILGEGIRTARVVTILKPAGAKVESDEALCEVETDKAIFPIECDADGILGEWLIGEGDEVQVGQELVLLNMDQPVVMHAASIPAASNPDQPLRDSAMPTQALSPEAIASIQRTVPATIEMTCSWENVHNARLRSKALKGGTISTSAMTAWAVVQAMGKHKRFASVQPNERSSQEPECFDVGIAVALPGDKLETAVIKQANKFTWTAFLEAFHQALQRVRHGGVDSKNRVPITITSMSTHNVRSAIPVVVPPALATLFVGAPYSIADPSAQNGGGQLVVSLVLTFDHRWNNGVGAAAFLSDIRKGIERFAEA